jgi:hypothetical protein
MIDVLSGQPLKQDITIDISEAARSGKQQPDELHKSLLQCFIADLDTTVKEPTSYDVGSKDPQQRQHWIEGDEVERNRITDVVAYQFRILKQNRPASTSDTFCELSE